MLLQESYDEKPTCKNTWVLIDRPQWANIHYTTNSKKNQEDTIPSFLHYLDLVKKKNKIKVASKSIIISWSSSSSFHMDLENAIFFSSSPQSKCWESEDYGEEEYIWWELHPSFAHIIVDSCWAKAVVRPTKHTTGGWGCDERRATIRHRGGGCSGAGDWCCGHGRGGRTALITGKKEVHTIHQYFTLWNLCMHIQEYYMVFPHILGATEREAPYSTWGTIEAFKKLKGL